MDLVIVIAMNDAFVMSAWSKANGVKDNDIASLACCMYPLLLTSFQMFMSDPGIAFSKSIGWTKGPERTGRYAMVIDHGKIVYAENEPGGDITV